MSGRPKRQRSKPGRYLEAPPSATTRATNPANDSAESTGIETGVAPQLPDSPGEQQAASLGRDASPPGNDARRPSDGETNQVADNPTESTGIASNGQPDDGAAVAVAPSDQPSSADNNSDANSRRKPGRPPD